MLQLSLFPDESPAPSPVPPALDAPTFTTERQILLFADHAVLARELDLALASGDLDQARRVRALALETYGERGPAAGYAFLDVLDTAFFARPARDAIEAWARLDAGLPARAGRRALLRRVVIGRLLDREGPASLAAQAPGRLDALCAVLVERHGEEGRQVAREIVRDALLEGRRLEPRSFAHDAEVEAVLADEVLAGDWSPPAQAAIGAIARVWATIALPVAGMDELHRHIEAAADGPSTFWTALCAARTPGRSVAVLHEARTWMKTSEPRLHAFYMQHG